MFFEIIVANGDFIYFLMSKTNQGHLVWIAVKVKKELQRQIGYWLYYKDLNSVDMKMVGN